jgi:hypothetical protein
VDRFFEVFAPDHAEEPAHRVRDEGVAHLSTPPHVIKHLVGAHTRAKRCWPILHDILGQRFGSLIERIPPDPAEDYPLVVHDDTLVPPVGSHQLRDVGDGCVEPAGWNVGERQVSDYWEVGVLPFTRKTRRQPIGLSGDVMENVRESEALEPPRGSRAQVSLIVPTVGHDGSRPIQLGYRLPIQLLQRDVDRTRQVLLHKLSLREHLQDLGPLGPQASYFLAIDFLGHGPLHRGGFPS